jgi:adenosylcobinamide-phosphate synthase
MFLELGSIWFVLPAAFVLDVLLGDPFRLPHPVRWMGKAIIAFEPAFQRSSLNKITSGILFALLLIIGTWAVMTIVVIAAAKIHPLLCACIHVIAIYYCLSARSLYDAAMEIYGCLNQNQITTARQKVALIVGRDVQNYNENGIARATVETVAENLVDGVVAPLFFAALGGAPLAMAYKMVNTLDSMVGYKSEKYIHFGKASARIDDAANFLPARFSIPLIAAAFQMVSGQGRRSFVRAVKEGGNHASPNAGYPEAAFAGGLAVKLNGPNYYHGQLVEKPYIGVAFEPPGTADIKKACDIMMLSSVLSLVGFWGASILIVV